MSDIVRCADCANCWTNGSASARCTMGVGTAYENPETDRVRYQSTYKVGPKIDRTCSLFERGDGPYTLGPNKIIPPVHLTKIQRLFDIEAAFSGGQPSNISELIGHVTREQIRQSIRAQFRDVQVLSAKKAEISNWGAWS